MKTTLQLVLSYPGAFKLHLLLLVIALLSFQPAVAVGPVVHYTFDEDPIVEGTTTIDSSGNTNGTFHDNNTGLDANKSVAAGGSLGGAIDFDGTDLTLSDIVEFQIGNLPTESQAALSGSAARTFAAWVNPDSLGDKRIFSYGAGAAGQFFAITLEGADNAADVYYRRGGGWEVYTPSQATNPIDIDNPDYIHIAAVVPVDAANTEDLLVYVNGQLATLSGGGGTVDNPALNTGVSGTSSYFGVGRRGQDTGVAGGSQAGFDGQIADFQFYDLALTSSEISSLYNNPGSTVNAAEPVLNLLELVVDRATGTITLQNPASSSDMALDLSYYEIKSASDSLNSAGWTSLDSQDIDSAGSAPEDQWKEAGGAGDGVLAESFLLGSSTFGLGRSESLGTAYNNTLNAEDLVFSYELADSRGQLVTGIVSYINEAPGLVGDYNADGIVDLADYTVWRNNLGASITLPGEDGTATPGQVTVEDYQVWKDNFGNSLAPITAASQVPEPATWVMLSMLGLLLGSKQCLRRAKLAIGCSTAVVLLIVATTANAQLVVHYQLEEDPTSNNSTNGVADSSGNANSGTLLTGTEDDIFPDIFDGDDVNKSVTLSQATGNQNPVPTGLGKAYDFDGGFDDVTEAESSDLIITEADVAPSGSSQRTYAVWFAVDSVNNSGGVGDNRLFAQGTAGDGAFFTVTFDGNGVDDTPATQIDAVRFRYGGSHAYVLPDLNNDTAPDPIQFGDWHHLVISTPAEGSGDGNAVLAKDVRLFLDGQELVADLDNSTTEDRPINTGVSQLGVGARPMDIALQRDLSFDGQIADFQLYDIGVGAVAADYLYTNPGSTLPAPTIDIDGVSGISSGDYLKFLERFQDELDDLTSLTALNGAGDFNYDGYSTFADYTYFREQFNLSQGAGAFESMLAGLSVPEPSSISVCALALLAAAACYRRPVR